MHCRALILFLIWGQSGIFCKKSFEYKINYSSRFLCWLVIGRAASDGGFSLVESGQVQGCTNNSSAVEESTELILVKFGINLGSGFCESSFVIGFLLVGQLLSDQMSWRSKCVMAVNFKAITHHKWKPFTFVMKECDRYILRFAIPCLSLEICDTDICFACLS